MMPDLDEFLSKKRGTEAQPSGLDAFLEKRKSAPPQPEPPGFAENIAIGLGRFGSRVADEAMQAGEAVSNITGGRPGRAVDYLEQKGREVLAGESMIPIAPTLGGRPDRRLQQLKAEAEQRDSAGTLAYKQRIEERAAADPSTAGMITRGGAQVGASVAAGMIPGLRGVAGRGFSRFRGATAKPTAPVYPREVSRPAASATGTPNRGIPEQAGGLEEFLARKTAGRGRLIDDPVRPPSDPTSQRIPDPTLFDPEEVGGFYSTGQAMPSAGMNLPNPNARYRPPSSPGTPNGPLPNLQALNPPPAPSAPLTGRQRAKEIGRGALTLPRALMSSGDISAPLRQGAILSTSPRNWGKAIRATGDMFKSLSPKRYERLTAELDAVANATGADAAGLYRAAGKSATAGEEAFASSFAENLPVLGKYLIQPSNRAYTAYLDSIRVSVFEKFARTIRRSGLSDEAATKALQDYASFINVATGRGTFGKSGIGQSLDRASDVLSAVLFAPKYTASRFNVLNPIRYARMNPNARKEAMKDLVGFAGVAASTIGLLKAAGAEVDLDPSSGTFAKAKFGRYTYDLGAGLTQVVRTLYRLGDDTQRAVRGVPAEKQTTSTLSVSGRFVRSKLAPVPSYFVDMFDRKTYDYRPFSAGMGVIERMTPLMWQDFYEAAEADGLIGGLKTLPGGAGVGVMRYGDKAPPSRTRPRRAGQQQQRRY